ncbi:uncharacterized protein [Primulina huaijiensis]|uniref:uncharacterized protein n=1 Tax=Primulina huaijiensis TaxID=1492673 RepID=UPI003CC7975F
MADNQHHELKSDEQHEAAPVHFKIEEIDQPVVATDRGLFDSFGKRKDENKCEEDAIASEFDDKVQVCDEKKEEPKFEVCDEKKEEPKVEEKKHESLLEKLHRSSSSSSSSSDEEEEVEEGGEKKKKKGLKDKIKEKITGEKKGAAAEETSVPVEKCDEIPTPELEEKKGFLDKIKEKLPGGKKTEEVWAAPPPPKEEVVECATLEAEDKEKKGFLDKIKEKLPGYHPKGEEEKKEKGV